MKLSGASAFVLTDRIGKQVPRLRCEPTKGSCGQQVKVSLMTLSSRQGPPAPLLSLTRPSQTVKLWPKMSVHLLTYLVVYLLTTSNPYGRCEIFLHTCETLCAKKKTFHERESQGHLALQRIVIPTPPPLSLLQMSVWRALRPF